MKPIIFDSWPLVAFFDNEPSAEKIEKLIVDALKNNREMKISVINLGEIWYSYARSSSEKIADELIEKVQSMDIKPVSVDWKIARLAARFKKQGGISYADCFAAALAKQSDGELVTGDREFQQFEQEVEIVWV